MKTLNKSIILILILLLAACNSESTAIHKDVKGVNNDPKENAYSGGDLRIAIDAQPSTLDTHTVSTTATKEIARHIYETLLTVDSNYEVVPMLAESYEQSEDQLTYTFHLRKGVKFHNGKEMKAEDVIASMERWLKSAPRAANAVGAGIFTEKDEYTVVFELESSAFGLLDVFAATNQFAAIMPKEVIESASNGPVTEIIGTGPFRFVEWKQDQYIQLEKFDDYVPVDLPSDGLSGKKEALVDNIYFDVVTDESIRLAGLITGEYHYAYGLSYDNYNQIEKTPGLEPSVNLYGAHNIVFNKKEGIVTNPKLRQAINYAINKEEILSGTFINKDFYRLDNGVMLKEQVKWNTDAGKEFYNGQDLEKAKALLKEAGYNGEEIRVLATRDYNFVYTPAVIFKEQMERIGVNVKLDITDWGTLVQKVREPNGWEVLFNGYAPVSTPTQTTLLDKDSPGWPEDEKLISLLEGIRKAESQEVALAKLAELQEYNWSEYLSYIKLGDFYRLSAYQDIVKGIGYFEGIVLWNTSLAE
ncbi:ABC transporter substrate-binding protein [Cytobacillus depressus]|uniref:ABC transporter substrate-binding protein n=1 Tax=Cytobacillus depressus TaxID=1602942 RepID=UPI001478E143|nr:ABC transporter substrate-binding protein [Cytobacillus depressus]